MAICDSTPVGAKFNRLAVISAAWRERGNGQWYVKCKCDCGAERVVLCKNIVKGHTKSCGCLSRETKRSGNKTHGMSNTPTWHTYNGMLTRCLNQNSDAYAIYGGRGITVCDRWKSSFKAFLSDMGERPKGTTLDRIDNNGPYSPSNCRWATDAEQRSNKSTSRFLEFNGCKRTIKEWSDITGIYRGALDTRVKLGWSSDRILTEPTVSGKNQFGVGQSIEFNGRSLTIREWSKEVGIKPDAIRRRLKRGWSVEKALNEPLRTKRV